MQLDDELVGQLDRWARKVRISRSELIRRAVAAHLRDLDWKEQDKVTVEAYRRSPESPEGLESWTNA